MSSIFRRVVHPSKARATAAELPAVAAVAAEAAVTAGEDSPVGSRDAEAVELAAASADPLPTADAPSKAPATEATLHEAAARTPSRSLGLLRGLSRRFSGGFAKHAPLEPPAAGDKDEQHGGEASAAAADAHRRPEDTSQQTQGSTVQSAIVNQTRLDDVEGASPSTGGERSGDTGPDTAVEPVEILEIALAPNQPVPPTLLGKTAQVVAHQNEPLTWRAEDGQPSSADELIAVWLVVKANSLVGSSSSLVASDTARLLHWLKKMEWILLKLDPTDGNNPLRHSMMQAGVISLCLRALETHGHDAEVCSCAIALLIHMAMNDETAQIFTAELQGVPRLMNLFCALYHRLKEVEAGRSKAPATESMEATASEPAVLPPSSSSSPSAGVQSNESRTSSLCAIAHGHLISTVLSLVWRLAFAFMSDGSEFAKPWFEAGAPLVIMDSLASSCSSLANPNYVGWSLGALRLLSSCPALCDYSVISHPSADGTTDLDCLKAKLVALPEKSTAAEGTNGSSNCLRWMIEGDLLNTILGQLERYHHDILVLENGFAVLANMQQIDSLVTQKMSATEHIWDRLLKLLQQEATATCDVVFQGLFCLGVAVAHGGDSVVEGLRTAGAEAVIKEARARHECETDISNFATSLLEVFLRGVSASTANADVQDSAPANLEVYVHDRTIPSSSTIDQVINEPEPVAGETSKLLADVIEVPDASGEEVVATLKEADSVEPPSLSMAEPEPELTTQEQQ
eukprot:GHVT01099849.1.p1 GENE.GHVT01099849.1~~GHVT01099849.1.p1  ORF type:complete len:819 (-),score=171.99 GHVT01099849.1:1345-3570(-)